jgi:hypothetical protein
VADKRETPRVMKIKELYNIHFPRASILLVWCDIFHSLPSISKIKTKDETCDECDAGLDFILHVAREGYSCVHWDFFYILSAFLANERASPAKQSVQTERFFFAESAD